MKFLRPLAGVILLDVKRSEEIRTQLNTYKMRDKVEQQKKNRSDHIMSMELDRLPKLLLNYKSKSRRDRERPRTRWENSLDVGTGQ